MTDSNRSDHITAERDERRPITVSEVFAGHCGQDCGTCPNNRTCSGATSIIDVTIDGQTPQGPGGQD